MVAPHAIIFIEFQQMVKIANNINITVIKFYNNNVILYNINIIVHYGIYQVSIRPVGLVFFLGQFISLAQQLFVPSMFIPVQFWSITGHFCGLPSKSLAAVLNCKF